MVDFARQHLDAVLLYETYSTSEIKSNPLAITKLALIGFFLPTENVEADGRAQAVLFDVRNGYTYGFASARAEDAGLKLSTSGNEYANARIMQHNAKTTAVANLAVEVETMMRDLRLQLAEKRAVPVEPVLEKKAGVK